MYVSLPAAWTILWWKLTRHSRYWRSWYVGYVQSMSVSSGFWTEMIVKLVSRNWASKYCGIHCVPFVELMLLFSYRYLFVISIYYDAIPYLISSSFYSILSVSSVIVQFFALHHTYVHKPVLILIICFTYLVSISHTVLFHITCVYSLPE